VRTVASPPHRVGACYEARSPGARLFQFSQTTDPETGLLYLQSEDEFATRVRAGKLIAGSHLPRTPAGRMGVDDPRSIYRHLMSVAPVRNETAPSVQRLG
jgi:hypothetical protein